MMNWHSIVFGALSECGITTPTALLSPQNLLMWGTEAQHEYQSWARPVRRECNIEIDSTIPDYDLPCNWKRMTIDFVRYQPPDGDTSVRGGNVRLVTWETYVRMSQSLLTDDPSAQLILQPGDFPVDNITVGGASFIGAVNAATNKLWLNPMATGTLWIRYLPELTPYSPDDPDWAKFGPDPSKEMKVSGPEPEMKPALAGIKAYIKTKIAETGVLSSQQMKFYPLWLKTYEECKYLLGREDTDYHEELPVAYTAGLY